MNGEYYTSLLLFCTRSPIFFLRLKSLEVSYCVLYKTLYLCAAHFHFGECKCVCSYVALVVYFSIYV